MRLFTRGRALALLALSVISVPAGTQTEHYSRYPNELQGFKFYAKYLAPLRPGVSTAEEVSRVLGDTASVKRDGWAIIPTYTTKGGAVYDPTLETLFEIIVRPDGVIPMAAVKFLPAFSHCHSMVSEIHISFDVYSDTSGLEYWLHEEDSRWGKKGDLFRIVYGRPRAPYPPNTVC